MEQKVSFKNSKGNKLAGIISDPSGDRERAISILVHGFSSNKTNSTNKALTPALNKLGFPTFRFDIFAHGESEGDFADLTQSEAVDDVLKAISYVKSLGYKKIGLVGSSFGGIASSMAASRTSNIGFLVLKCPVSSYFEFTEYTDKKTVEDWKKNGYSYREGKKLKYAFYEDIWNNIAYDVAHQIKVPTLIVHGDADRDVPVSQSIKLAKLIPDCRLEIIPGADHRFTKAEDFGKMISLITDFIAAKAV